MICCARRDEAVDERVVDRLVDVGARSGDAGLPRRGEDAGQHPCLRLIEVGIVEHDVRALAAELEHAADEPLARARRDRAAGPDAAGERDLRDQRMIDERLAGLAKAGDDVDDAGRDAGGFGQPRQLDRRKPT